MMKIKSLPIACTVVCLLLRTGVFSAPLSGIYTIGGASPSYATFNLAVADLTANGVSGPVTFNVRAGTYNETITINNITGNSSTKYILFQSESGVASDVALTYTSATVILNGSKNITFKNMTINGTANPPNSGSTTSATFVLQGNCNTDSLINCVLTAPLAPWTDYTYVINASSGTNDNIYVKGCQVIGGGFGYEVEGGGSNFGPYLTNNTWTNQTYMAIDLMGCNNVLIQQNLITATNSRFGIILWNATNNVNIISNKITGTIGTGMYVPTLGGGNNILIANNFIEASYGIYGIYTYNYLILHNSFLTSTYGIYMYVCSGNIVQDNIFYSTGGSYVFNLDNVSCFSASDYNDFYTTGNVATVNSVNYTTLANWRTLSGFDAHTMNLLPPYTSNTDLHLTVDNMRFGMPQALVPNDIDNQTRNTITPDVGADEFGSCALTTSPNSSICLGLSSTLTVGGGSNYTWMPASTLSSATATSVLATPTTTTTYSVAGGGCPGSYTVMVTILNSPLSVTPNQTICLGTPQVLSSTGAVSYSWSPSVYLSTTTGSMITATPTVSGGYTYSVTGTDGHGCNNTASVKLNVVSSITASAGADASTCSGATVMLNGSGGSSYTWAPSSGLTNYTSAATTFTLTTPGAYTYTLTAYLGLGCTSADAVQINVNGLPTLSTGASQTICTGSGTTLSVVGGTTYSWSPKTFLNSQTGSIVTATPTLAGVRGYTVTGTDQNGCSSKAAVTVTVGNIPTLSAMSGQSICSGNTLTLTATGSSGNYSWMPSTGITNATSNVTTVNQVTAGAYTYTITLTGTTCSASMSKTVTLTINPLPTLATSQNQTVCAGSTTQLSATGASSYQWNTGQNNNIITVTTTTTTTYSVTGTDQNGCSSTAMITLSPVTPASTANNVTINKGETVTLSIAGNGSGYQWTPSAGLSCTNCSSPAASPEATTKYYITISYGNGCTTKDSITVTVKDKCSDIYIPTAFSPNGDNENEVFYIKTQNTNCIDNMIMEIYDRWGRIVFQTTDINRGWDGKLNGTVLNSAVFVYKFQATLKDGTQVINKGNISLIR